MKSKLFARYVSLSVIGMIFLSAYILADTFFISLGVGSNGLTALNIILPLFNLLNGLGLLIGFGGGSRYIIHKSQGDDIKANKVFMTSLYLALIFSILFILSGFFASDILKFFSAEGKVLELGTTYLSVMFFFSPAFLLNNLLLGFMRNDNAPSLAMAGQIVGSLSNVLLDYIFIFPLKMGIFGAILATGLSPIISISIMMIHFIQKKNGFKISKYFVDFLECKKIILSGLPSLISEVSAGIVVIVFNYLIGKSLGDIGIASYGVVANLSLVFIAVFTGISQGVQPLISKCQNKEANEERMYYFKAALITIIVISTVIYAFIFFGNGLITSMFNHENNPILQEVGEKGLREYFIALPFVGINMLISVYFAAISKPLKGQIISACRGLILLIPLAFLLEHFFNVDGVFSSFPSAEIITAILSICFMVLEIKKIRKLQLPDNN